MRNAGGHRGLGRSGDPGGACRGGEGGSRVRRASERKSKLAIYEETSLPRFGLNAKPSEMILSRKINFPEVSDVHWNSYI